MIRYPDFAYLTEDDISHVLLLRYPNLFSGKFLCTLKKPSHDTAVLGPLQEPQLIAAIYYKNYPGIYRRLEKLTQPLSPSDAMAACLCALNGTRLLMNRVLDHCPPIPQFQFQGTVSFPSLAETTVRYNFPDKLDILLRRGADPNRDPGDLQQISPLESAFCSDRFPCLLRLLQEPTLDLTLTERILEHWGRLRESHLDAASISDYVLSCQFMYECVTGQTLLPEEYSMRDEMCLPIPHQLRLRHALKNNNMELAIRLLREHPLDEEDLKQALSFFSEQCAPLLTKDFSNKYLFSWPTELTELLLQFLNRCPQLLETPQLRQALCTTALCLLCPDIRLQSWVEKLEPGPIQLSAESLYDDPVFACLFGETAALNHAVLLRWKERLPDGLRPALSRHNEIYELSSQDMELLLKQVIFIGAPVPGQLSRAARCILERAPEYILPQLMQGDGLLASEDQTTLLNACQKLSPARRSQILPYIKKNVCYDL